MTDGRVNAVKQQTGMSFVDHLGELRKRVVRIVIVFVIGLIAGFAVANPVIHYLMSVPPASGLAMNVFSPWDSLRIYINVSMLAALIVTLPFAIYQIWLFVAPGLLEKERKAAAYYIPLAAVLGAAGLAFAYWVVFPLAFHFTLFLTNTMQLTETYGITQYFAFMFNILIPVTLVFELPVVVLFLTTVRILSPNVLIKARRIAYVVLVVISTLITPPDLISAMIVFLPLVILYELSVFLSRLVHRKQKEREAAPDASLQET